MLIAGMNELKEAIAFAKAAESKWPRSMKMPDGQFVMTYDSGEKAPDNEVLGPVTPQQVRAIDLPLVLAGRGDDVGGSGSRWHTAKYS